MSCLNAEQTCPPRISVLATVSPICAMAVLCPTTNSAVTNGWIWCVSWPISCKVKLIVLHLKGTASEQPGDRRGR